MQRLFKFIYQYRSFFTFITLEILCFFLIIQNNRFQSASFFNSTNFVSASILNLTTDIQDYFYLDEVNQRLAEENARLQKLIEDQAIVDSTAIKIDSVYQFKFITARVINNATKWQNNSLTIDKGLMDGIEREMGVLGSGGVVGKVRYASNRYGVLTSLLHSKFTVSSRIKNKVELCTTEWDGVDPGYVQIRFVPRHHVIEIGDSVLTSGYNAIFPKDIPIGVITDINISPEETFYSITAKLVNDFSTLSYVHVVVNRFKIEKDSIESLIISNE